MARSMRTGVSDFYVAKATQKEGGAIEFDTPHVIGGTAKVSVSEERGENKVYESNALIRSTKKLSSAKITYSSHTVSLEDEIEMIYGTEASEDGSYDVGVDDTPDHHAVGWASSMSDGRWRCVWYYYCTASKGDESHETSTENETTPEDSYEFVAMPRPDTRKLKRKKICKDAAERDAFFASVLPAAQPAQASEEPEEQTA